MIHEGPSSIQIHKEVVLYQMPIHYLPTDLQYLIHFKQLGSVLTPNLLFKMGEPGTQSTLSITNSSIYWIQMSS
jgi:hypothetical protein